MLAPELAPARSQPGSGRTVALAVIDERPELALGRRTTAFGGAAEISTEQDVAEVIRMTLAEGLRRRGFTIVPSAREADIVLRMELRLLEQFATAAGIMSIGTQTRAAMKADVVKKSDPARIQLFDKIYRAESMHDSVFSPPARVNARMINKTLSALVNEVLEDEELISFLAG